MSCSLSSITSGPFVHFDLFNVKVNCLAVITAKRERDLRGDLYALYSSSVKMSVS